MLERCVSLLRANLAQPKKRPTRRRRATQCHLPRKRVAALGISVALVFDHSEPPPALGPIGTQLDRACVEFGGLFGMIGLVGLLRSSGKFFEGLRRALRSGCRCEQQEKAYWSHFRSLLPRS